MPRGVAPVDAGYPLAANPPVSMLAIRQPPRQ
jgi:hypothetical protein